MCPNGSKPHKDNNGDWDETRLGQIIFWFGISFNRLGTAN